MLRGREEAFIFCQAGSTLPLRLERAARYINVVSDECASICLPPFLCSDWELTSRPPTAPSILLTWAPASSLLIWASECLRKLGNPLYVRASVCSERRHEQVQEQRAEGGAWTQAVGADPQIQRS